MKNGTTSMDGKLRRRLDKALAEVDEHETRGPRLVDDAERLCARVKNFVAMKLIPTEPDVDALELACFALQLPQKHLSGTAGKPARSSLKQRAEASAELLVSLLGEETDESLLDRTTRLLHETPQRQPMIEESRLLADALNLDDFGVTGMVAVMVQIAQQGGGAKQLLDAYDKRDQYGYWDARLKEGFHFEAVRKLARQRLQQAREVTAALLAEMKEDQS